MYIHRHGWTARQRARLAQRVEERGNLLRLERFEGGGEFGESLRRRLVVGRGGQRPFEGPWGDPGERLWEGAPRKAQKERFFIWLESLLGPGIARSDPRKYAK